MKAHPLLVLLGALLAGCNDSPPPPSAPKPAPAGANDYFGQAAQAQTRANKTVDLAAVNKAIQEFYIQEGRFPSNLLELAASDFIRTIPTLPKGLAWDYDRQTGTAAVIKEGLKD